MLFRILRQRGSRHSMQAALSRDPLSAFPWGHLVEERGFVGVAIRVPAPPGIAERVFCVGVVNASNW